MRLPAGVRDWLPAELSRKREVEQKLRAVFGRWAYQEVQTPGFERFDVLEFGLGEALVDQTFRFSDRRANALALRPEMTTPIARLVSTRMRQMPLPIRLSYVAPAYRYEEPQEGRMREFTQAGVELIGAAGLDADAEALFMAIESLDACGLGDTAFDINDAAVVDGALEGFAIEPPARAICKTLIADRNIVALRSFGEPRLLDFALLRGGTEAIAQARTWCATPPSLAALDRLEAMLSRARALGHARRVSVDFALLRDLEYYTGFVFEGFIADLGFSLCGGGRYDSLLPRFGYDVPAVGWTAGVERILIALERRGRHHDRKRPRIDLLVCGSDVIAARERSAGNVVRFAAGDASEADLLEEARAHAIPRIVIARDGAVRELRVRPDLDGHGVAEYTHPFGEASH